MFLKNCSISDCLIVINLKFTKDKKTLDIFNKHIEDNYRQLIDSFGTLNELTRLDYSIGCLIIRSLFTDSDLMKNIKNIENFMSAVFLKLLYNFEKNLNEDKFFYMLRNFTDFLTVNLQNNVHVERLKFSFVRNILNLINKRIQLKLKNESLNNNRFNLKVNQLDELIDKLVDAVITVYDFKDFYMESIDIFKKSIPCGLIKKLTKILLDDYNFVINLKTLNNFEGNSRIKEINNWKRTGDGDSENLQMYQIITFLDSLISKLNQKTVNTYLFEKISRNFNINFLHSKIFYEYNKNNSSFFVLLIGLLFKLDSGSDKQITSSNYIRQFLSRIDKFELYSKEILIVMRNHIDDVIKDLKGKMNDIDDKLDDNVNKQTQINLTLENFITLFSNSIVKYEFPKYSKETANTVISTFIENLTFFFKTLNKNQRTEIDFSENFQIALTVIWIKLMKSYYLMNSETKEKLRFFALITPFLKSEKHFTLHELEVTIILREPANNNQNIKAIQSDFPKLKDSRKSYLIYNFIFYFIFHSKIKEFKNLLSKGNKSIDFNNRLVENAFLYLREDYEVQIGQRADGFLSNIKKTFNLIFKEYKDFVRKATNFNFLFDIVKQDFIVLLQYSVSDNKSLSMIARDHIKDYIQSYPFMLYSIEVFDTTVVILDLLFKNYNSKFSTISTHLQTNHHDQMITIPMIKVF